MLIARRLYLYLISYISLGMLLFGGANLLKLLLERWLTAKDWYIGYNDSFRQEFSLWGAVLIVGTVVWVIHWVMAQKSVVPSRPGAAQERSSVLRKLMIYAVLLVSIWQIVFAVDGLLHSILMNLPDLGSIAVRNSFSSSFPVALVFGVVWFYYWWIRTTDNRLQPEQKGGATVRRWYFYIVCYGTLSLLIYHSAELLYNVWLVVTGTYLASVDTHWIPGPIADNLAWVLVALPAWLWHWLQTQRLTASSEDEQHSILRKLYLYLAITQTVAVTLVSLAFFLYHMLRFAMGSSFVNDAGGSLLTAASLPFCNALVYGVFWAFYSQILKWDTALIAQEPPLQANLRRLYYHLVALVSLIVLSIGLARLVRILLDLWLGGDTTVFSREGWSNEISLFTTLILAGGTVWYFSWAPLQKKALGQDGAAERKAIFRRIYLYLVIFLSVVTLLGSTAWLIYQIFLIVGKPITGELISEMSWALGATATATLMLVYHLRIMLGDLKANAPVVASAPSSQSQTVLLFVAGTNPVTVTERLAGIKDKLPPGCQLELIPAAGLTLPELKYWLSEWAVAQSAKSEKGGNKPVAVG